jgi:short-subunit dehydrogenase
MDLRRNYPNVHVSLVVPGLVATEFHNNALDSTPTERALEMPSIEQVVHAIEQVIDHPVPEVYTSPWSENLVQRYYQDGMAFEEEIFKRSAVT